MAALGMVRGVSHTEFIKARTDGRIYFLETSARVGGAHIVDLVEAATGLNLWAEWAKVELTERYEVAVLREEYAALLISLARQERPDTSQYCDPEVVWRLMQDHHAGLIVRSESYQRVADLLGSYERRFIEEFYAYQPPQDKPSN
jgi:biotin carboxylase